MQIHMKSDRGEIEVFLCPEEDALGVCSNIEDSEADTQSPIKIKREGQINYNAPQLHAYVSSSLSQKMESNGPFSTLEASPSGGATTWEAPSRNSGGGDEDSQVCSKPKSVNILRYLFNHAVCSTAGQKKSTQ